MIKYFALLSLLTILFIGNLTAQIKFNSSGGTPDASAIMELESSSQGVLIPRMLSSSRLSISSPAQGLLVFQTDGTVGFYYYNGIAWDTLGGATNVVNISNVTNISNSGIAVVRDERASGVDGGTFTSGSWVTRELNSLSGDVSFVSLSANAFTLDSGVYIITINAPARRVDKHQVRLYNNTTGSVVSVGSAVTSANASSSSLITATVSVTSATNTFIIQHRCETTRLTDGLGEAVSWGTTVFTQVKIEKL